MGALPQERKGEFRGNIYIPTGDLNQPLYGGLFSTCAGRESKGVKEGRENSLSQSIFLFDVVLFFPYLFFRIPSISLLISIILPPIATNTSVVYLHIMDIERDAGHMVTSVRFRNFRCFQDLSASGLTRFNLISGKNNTGKTAFLEGLFILIGAVRPNLAININSFRGLGIFGIEDKPKSEKPWDSAFWNYDTEKAIKLVGVDQRRKTRTVTLMAEKLRSVRLESSSAESKDTRMVTAFPYGLRLVHVYGKKRETVFLRVDQQEARVEPSLSVPMPGIFIHARTSQNPREDAQRFGRLQVIKGEQLLLDALRTIEPRIKSVTAVPIGDISVLHGDIGKSRLMPLPLMGGGTVRLTSILLAIADAPKGVVLIDEIENGFHHTVLPYVWKSVRKLAARTGTQIFATTHSIENIRAAHQVFKTDAEYDLSFYRLDRKDSEILVKRYGKETIQAAFEADLEMR